MPSWIRLLRGYFPSRTPHAAAKPLESSATKAEPAAVQPESSLLTEPATENAVLLGSDAAQARASHEAAPLPTRDPLYDLVPGAESPFPTKGTDAAVPWADAPTASESVDLAIAHAASPASDAEVVASLPALPAKGPIEAARAIVRVATGASHHVTPVDGPGLKGFSGAPVYTVKTPAGEPGGVVKVFNRADEFVGELVTHQVLRGLELNAYRFPELRGVGRLERTGDDHPVLFMSRAPGEQLDDLTFSLTSAADPAARAEARKHLEDAVTSIARGTAELHQAGRDPRNLVSRDFLRFHADVFQKNLQRLRDELAGELPVRPEFTGLFRRANELVENVLRSRGLASYTHGDLQMGNAFYDPHTGHGTLIDLFALSRSVGAKGQPTGAAARDVENFVESLLVNGVDFGLSRREAAALAQRFRKEYVAAGGDLSHHEAHAFFAARKAISLLVEGVTKAENSPAQLQYLIEHIHHLFGVALRGGARA